MNDRCGVRVRIKRLTTSAVLILAVGAAAIGCARFPAPESPPPVAFGARPLPPGAQTDVPEEPVPSFQNCDATVSLRPGPMPPPAQMPQGSTMADILENGRLIVGLDIGSNLFSFRDPISGDIQGFDVDIARAIARAIFGDEATIEFRVLSSADRTEALADHSVDVVVKTMSITCDRLEEVSFSTPYYVAYQRILSTRNSGVTGPRHLIGKRVCAARGATSIGRIQAIVPRVRMVTTTTWADCLVMMQQGQADAVSTDDAILAGLAEQDPWVELVGPSLGAEYYGVGIPQGQDDMVRFVNGVLDQLRSSGQWQQMYERWLSILGPSNGPPQPVYRD
ncbi:transporter substrate-binding domain-containing protein [Gordonia sp. HNM0687]|uniref:Transporter substrate-binding domain-containing protein n=1 Tax=Gordonia mangrovi TaxID=2665643 RepID=A0A6L7GUQ4_9ACTN|nr:glutamate ABC transporter substrate-binding protein [Gordonia mangrovi]MXP23676.1 transporter substrate-binding domain-containing protein [Gordonia mangrovi]UVF79736.1 glutamate ABC transporter substrate-binding protein [Gordonia mangrovi]